MSGVQIIKVKADEEGMRVDRWFKTHFPSFRHGALEKCLRKGQVRVDGGRVKANRRLQAGEEIRVPPMSDADAERRKKAPPASPKDADFIRSHTIYEDDAVMAINKPFGLAVQGGAKTKRHVDGMLAALEKDGERPRLVHRLDRDTGGVLLLAKTRMAAQRLGEAFKTHTVHKTYWALVAGAPRPREGVISLAIAKRMVRIKSGLTEKVIPAGGEDAKKAVSLYQILDEAGHNVAFVALRPVTGRTHQLRVHCAAIECPVVGDGKYGGDAAHIEGVAPKLHLFCRSMQFRHPVTGRAMEISAPLTGHMAETWRFFGFDAGATCEWPEEHS
ncbi:MAG: RluA family pseudouridine synthase [Pseudomonadota bacterium]